MIYIMNSAVMPAGNYGTYRYSPASLDDLAAVLRGEYGPVQSCIGYPQNADLIKGWTGIRPEIARIETTFQPGDRAIVMRLKARVANPATKGAPVSSDPADWEFAWVDFLGRDLGHDFMKRFIKLELAKIEPLWTAKGKGSYWWGVKIGLETALAKLCEVED